MFSKLAVAFVATLAIFASAAPSGGSGISDSCNTGKMYCCEDTYESGTDEYNLIKDTFHVDIPINTKIGATCSPLTVIGVGSGANCNQQPVCCSGNDFNGLVVIGCSPITLNV